MICRFSLLGILLIIHTTTAYCQNAKDSIYGFRVYHRLSCPVVPFPTIEREISNFKLCSRNLLPPRYKMKSEQLDAYNSWDQRPKCIKISKEDYDSIVMCIVNLKLMDADKAYSNPKIVNGLTMMKSGSCIESYIIEKHHRKTELPIKNAYDFELPLSIARFDSLFKRIANKYIPTK